jgi:SAM-dependent methyltransferase/uncharacterized protein YbaR (Trm112 family)
MRVDLIPLLRCPECSGELTLQGANLSGDRVETGALACARSHSYPIRNFIPRFVSGPNYADNFGFQWNTFRSTQLDSYSGHPISAERFWKATDWSPAQIAGQWVLDAGCGAGRFAEIALRAGAKVVALDYSNAIDACFENLRQHPNLYAVQGNIFALPFKPGSFPFVYSFGVLQSTPDVPGAFAALPPMVKNGGRMSVDFYERNWKSIFLPKYWLRPITKRLPQARLFALLQTWVPRLFPLSSALARIPVLGRYLSNFVPIANYTGILPLNRQQQLEWSLLDTFDWYGPAYDSPQTPRTLAKWSREAGLQKIEVMRAGHLVARGMVVHGS